MRHAIGVLGALVIGIGIGIGLGARPLAAQSVDELREMTLEELLNVEVTTISRSSIPRSQIPAAAYVITADDIRRSGATSLAEALRLAPGMQVARIDAGKWSIGTRGFADRLSRSMLVLIDGRAVYSPLFAGTYWESQDVLLEDVERIEVIRGPGGTLWGSNAVNGIVSIVTRSAGETRGAFTEAVVGMEERQAGIRYGGELGESTFLRAYARGSDRQSQHHTGSFEYDDWRLAQAGARMDASLGGDHQLTVQGDAYVGRLDEFLRVTRFDAPFQEITTQEVPLSGGNLLARWSGPLGPLPSVQLQAYFDRTDREEYPVSEERNTFDVDLQVRQTPWTGHELVWGFGYRHTWANLETAPISMLSDDSEDLISAFVQDEVSLAADRLRLTAGIKLEHNPYSGLELMPSGRIAWLPSPDHTAWGAVTRAVRRPSRAEREYATTSILDPSAPAFVRLAPNPGFDSEQLLAYEAGYRVRPAPQVFLTISAFYNEWRDMLSTELTRDAFVEDIPPDPPRLIFPVQFRNGLDGESYGFETTAEIRPASWWTIEGHYAFLRVVMDRKPGSTDLTQESRYQGGSPRHQVLLANSLDLPGDLTLDWHLRHVSELPDLGIPDYTTSDLRLAWQATDQLELEIVGRNLHQPHHAEWPGDNGGADVEIERSVYAGIAWRE